MSTTLKATYKQGALLLREPLLLEEDQEVDVIVLPTGEKNGLPTGEKNGGFMLKQAPDPQRVIEIMLEIAGLPLEATAEGPTETGARDHDHYLYGAKKQSENEPYEQKGESPETALPPDPAAATATWLKMAALPMEPGSDGFSGADHDRVLYGAMEAE